MFNVDRISEFVELANAFKNPDVLKTMEAFVAKSTEATKAIKANEKLVVELQFDRNALAQEKTEFTKAQDKLAKDQAEMSRKDQTFREGLQGLEAMRVDLSTKLMSIELQEASMAKQTAILADKVAKLDKKTEQVDALKGELEAKLENLKALVS